MKKQTQNGFTLIELLTTITVAAIILGIGIPAMTDFVRNSRMTGTANDLLAAMHVARSGAVSRRAPAIVCRSANAMDPSPSCDDAGTGWIVYVDANIGADGMPEGNGVVDAGELLLANQGPPDTITTKWLIEVGGAESSRVTYSSSGFLCTTGCAASATVFTLCDGRGNVVTAGANSAARAIVVSPTGRPQILRTIDEVTTAGGC